MIKCLECNLTIKTFTCECGSKNVSYLRPDKEKDTESLRTQIINCLTNSKDYTRINLRLLT